ncbi:MAG: hypothetical protein ABI947_15985 [Chloroflexota bacterium]
MKFDSQSRTLIWFCLYFVCGAIIALRFDPFDTEFITYRFADNLRTGHGLIYGTPGIAVTTYPVAPLMLTFTGQWLPAFSPALPLALAIGAIFLVRLANDRWLIGLAYILLAAWQPSTVIAIMLAFALAGLEAAVRNRWRLAGCLLGIAILTEPSAIVLAILTLLLVVRTNGSIQRYLVPVIAIPALTLSMIVLSINPNGSAVLVSIVPGFATILIPFLAVLLFVRYRAALTAAPQIALLVAWSAILIMLALFSKSLPTAAILPGLLAIFAVAPVAWLALVAACVEIVLGGYLRPTWYPLQTDRRMTYAQGDSFSPERHVGNWIISNTPESDTVATREIGAVMSFYAKRPVIDLSGRLQPIAFDRDFFLKYAPDTVVLDKDKPVLWEPFKTTYAKIEPKEYSLASPFVIYRRVATFTPLDDHPVDLVFAGNLSRDDLRLRGVAVANKVESGNLVRVRLDWDLAYAPSFDLSIRLKLVDGSGKTIAEAVDNPPSERWQSGQVNTYHLLVLPPKTTIGTLSLTVGVGIRNGDLGEHTVATLNVTK